MNSLFFTALRQLRMRLVQLRLLITASIILQHQRRGLTTAATCSTCQFTCRTSFKCIFIGFVCDSQNDCGPTDLSDETNCTMSPVSATDAVPLEDNFTIVANANPPGIGQVSIAESSSNDNSTAAVQQLVRFSTFASPMSVAFDPTTRYVYFSDVCYSAVYRYSLANRTVIRIYIDILYKATFDGLAVDTRRQKLYYTDAGYGRVGEMAMDGSTHRIIDRPVAAAKPRGIAFDSNNSILYWTEVQDTNPGIFRSHVTNINKTTLVTGNLGWPNALAIDFSAQLMYWGDALLHTIERSNLDGTGRIVLLTETSSLYYAMTLDSKFIYFTDWNSSHVRKLNRYTLQVSAETAASFGRSNGILAYRSQDALYTTTTAAATSTSTMRPTLRFTSASTYSLVSSSVVTAAVDESTASAPASANSRPASSGTSTTTVVIIIVVVVVVGIVLVAVVVAVGLVLYKCRRNLLEKTNSATDVQAQQPPPNVFSSSYDVLLKEVGPATEATPSSAEDYDEIATTDDGTDPMRVAAEHYYTTHIPTDADNNKSELPPLAGGVSASISDNTYQSLIKDGGTGGAEYATSLSSSRTDGLYSKVIPGSSAAFTTDARVC